jgi:hypothetical protein
LARSQNRINFLRTGAISNCAFSPVPESLDRKFDFEFGFALSRGSESISSSTERAKMKKLLYRYHYKQTIMKTIVSVENRVW